MKAWDFVFNLIEFFSQKMISSKEEYVKRLRQEKNNGRSCKLSPGHLIYHLQPAVASIFYLIVSHPEKKHTGPHYTAPLQSPSGGLSACSLLPGPHQGCLLYLDLQ